MPKLKSQSKSQRDKKKNEYIIKIRNQDKIVKAKNFTSVNTLDEYESQETSQNNQDNALSTHSDTIPYESKNKSDQNAKSRIQTSLPNIIVGDFSQSSNEFPLPHHQCTAMTTIALATASFTSVFSWNSNDLNNIIRAGQIYYYYVLLELVMNYSHYMNRRGIQHQ